MVVSPATAMLIATAVSAAAKGASDYFGNKKEKKANKRRAKETERETKANLVQDALQRSAELKGHKLSSHRKLAKGRAASSQETSDLIRGALKI